eukprot:1518290-Prymnesium_polylepis.1
MQDPPARQPQTAALFRAQMLVHRVVQPQQAFEWITAEAPDAWAGGGASRGRQPRRLRAGASRRRR